MAKHAAITRLGFMALAKQYGVTVDYRPPDRKCTAPATLDLMAPANMVFKSSGLHVDCSISAITAADDIDWERAATGLKGVAADGFIACDERDCDYCGDT